MANNDTSVNNGNGVRIACVATLLLARQSLPNCSLSNSLVDVVATNDGLYDVSAYLLLPVLSFWSHGIINIGVAIYSSVRMRPIHSHRFAIFYFTVS